VADRKISDFQQVSALASGFLVPIVDLSEPSLINQNKSASIAVFDTRYLTVSGSTISGQLIASSGTAAAPGLGVGQTNTGLFNPVGDSLGVTAGGQETGRFNGKGLTLVNSLYASGVVASGGSVGYVGVGVGRTDTGLFASNGSFIGTSVSGIETSRATQSGTYFRDTVVSVSGSLNKPGVAVGSPSIGLFSDNSSFVGTSVSGVEASRATQSGTYFRDTVVTTSGSLNKPGLAVGDSDTGLVLVDPNVLGVAAAGVEIVRFDPSGVTTFAGSGAIDIPVGTTAQRPTGSTGMFRFNSDVNDFEGYNGSDWSSLKATTTATGSGTDQIFILNQTTVSGSYAIPNGYNAMSTGPIVIASGVIVTVNSGSVWAVI